MNLTIIGVKGLYSEGPDHPRSGNCEPSGVLHVIK